MAQKAMYRDREISSGGDLMSLFRENRPPRVYISDRTDRNLKGLILKLSKLWKFNRWNMEKFFSIVPSDIELLMFISYSIDLFYD